MNIVFGPHMIKFRNNCKTYYQETDKVPSMCPELMCLFWLWNMFYPT